MPAKQIKVARNRSRLLIVVVSIFAIILLALGLLPEQVATVSGDPVRHNLTRSGWAAPCPGGGISYGYTTLEGYNRSGMENQYLIVSRKCNGEITATKVRGSAEGRSIFRDNERSLLIGSSLDPRLIRYDEASGSYVELFQGKPGGMWMHQIFAGREHAYVKLSMPSAKESLGKAIYKINLGSGEIKELPFECESGSNGYSGIQTVDTMGRIWLYAAYPVKYYWISKSSKCEPRRIVQYPNHKVLSWLQWRDKSYYVAVSPLGKFEYLPFESEQESATPRHLAGLLPADLFKTTGDRIERSVFVDSNGRVYRCDDSDCRRVALPLNFSRIETPVVDNEIRPRGITYIHDRYGLVEMVYARGKKFIFWVIDTKTFLDATEGEDDYATVRDSTRNATPANLTSLVGVGSANLVTAGYLTTSTLALVDKKTGKSVEYNGVVPFSQGQINYMLTEESGKIVGSVYPDAVYFIYDPSKAWSPGQYPDSNPFNFGPLHNHHQQRTYHGFSDRNGQIWFLSESDFSANKVHAISKIDVGRKAISTINTADHGIPVPLAAADYDDNRIVMIARNSAKVGFYLMGKDNYRLSYITEFPYESVACASAIVNGVTYNIVTGDRDVYYFDESSGLRKSMTAPGPVLKLVVEGHYVFLVGKRFISMIDLKNPTRLQTKLSWMFLRGKFFSSTHWLPVKIDVPARKFYFADDFKIESVYLDFDW